MTIRGCFIQCLQCLYTVFYTVSTVYLILGLPLGLYPSISPSKSSWLFSPYLFHSSLSFFLPGLYQTRTCNSPTLACLYMWTGCLIKWVVGWCMSQIDRLVSTAKLNWIHLVMHHACTPPSSLSRIVWSNNRSVQLISCSWCLFGLQK